MVEPVKIKVFFETAPEPGCLTNSRRVQSKAWTVFRMGAHSSA